MSGNGIIPLISAILTGLIGVGGTLLGVYYQRKSESHRQLVDKIYQPLYDGLIEVAEGELPSDASGEGFNSYWDGLDSYWQSKVDNELRDELNEYSDMLDAADTVFFVIADELVSNRELNDINAIERRKGSSEYEEVKLLFRQSSNDSRKTYTPLVDWFYSYSLALFQSTDTDELRSKLEKQADSLSPEHRRAIDSLDDRHILALSKAIDTADNQVEYPKDISSTSSLIEAIETKAESLSPKLEQKADSLIF
jgi:hypothetical protein